MKHPLFLIVLLLLLIVCIDSVSCAGAKPTADATRVARLARTLPPFADGFLATVSLLQSKSAALLSAFQGALDPVVVSVCVRACVPSAHNFSRAHQRRACAGVRAGGQAAGQYLRVIEDLNPSTKAGQGNAFATAAALARVPSERCEAFAQQRSGFLEAMFNHFIVHGGNDVSFRGVGGRSELFAAYRFASL